MDHSKHPLSDEQSHEVGIAGADADGWVANNGTQPVADDVLIDYEAASGIRDVGIAASHLVWVEYGDEADITHWRYHDPALRPKPAPDPRDEQIRQLREALRYVIAWLPSEHEAYNGFYSHKDVEPAMKAYAAARAALQATEPKA